MRRPLEQQIGDEHIHQAWLTSRKGAQILLHDVSIRADSVTGFADEGHERRAVPFADVASIERRQFSIARTGALVISTAVASILLANVLNSRGHEAIPAASPAASVR